jgi:hypothetical protein
MVCHLLTRVQAVVEVAIREALLGLLAVVVAEVLAMALTPAKRILGLPMTRALRMPRELRIIRRKPGIHGTSKWQ